MEKVLKSMKVIAEPNGDFAMFTLGLSFDDGSMGVAYAKSAQPPYSVGQVVEVVDTGKTTAKGTPKIKVSKLDGPPSAPQSYNNASPKAHSQSDNTKGMRDGMMCNVMSRLIAAGKIAAGKSVDESYKIAKEIINRVESADLPQGGGYGEGGKEAFDANEESEDVPF
jgi:hypothetical protein